MNGNGVWKWIAITLAAFMLGGVPGYLYQYLNTPTQEEVEGIRDTQEIILQRMVVLETQILNLQNQIENLEGVK